MANNISKELFKAEEVRERLKEIRKEKGVGWLKMSEVIDIVYETIRNFESGKTDKPRLKVIKPLFLEYGISLDYIVFGIEPKYIHIDDMSRCEKAQRDIGVRLYLLRGKTSHEQLAKELGICKRTIVRYENATSRRKEETKIKNSTFINGDNFSIDFLCRYSKHFKKSLNFIVFGIE